MEVNMQINIIINVIDSKHNKYKTWAKRYSNVLEQSNKVFDLDVEQYLKMTVNDNKLAKLIGDAIYDKALMKARIAPERKVWVYLNSSIIDEDLNLQKKIVSYISRQYGIEQIKPHYKNKVLDYWYPCCMA